jgi:glutathione S-transferase
MKLLGSPTSPYVRKVRLVIEEKNVPCEFVIDRPSDTGSQVPQFNPLGKVPVLVLDNGRALYDSPVIAEYLDGYTGKSTLFPAAFAERIEVRRWEALGDGIADATVAISHDFRKPKERRETPAWYEKQAQKIQRGLATIAKDLGDREFCHGNSFSLADIGAGYALAYLDRAWPDIDWRASHPTLKRYYDKISMRSSFQKTQHPAA